MLSLSVQAAMQVRRMWHRMVDHFCSCHAFEPDSKEQTCIGMARESSSITKNIDSLAILAEKETLVQVSRIIFEERYYLQKMVRYIQLCAAMVD